MKTQNTFWILLLTCCYQMNTHAQDVVYRTRILKNIIYTLTSDTLQNRANGTKEIEHTKIYIQNSFRDIGLIPYNGDYAHKFIYTKNDSTIINAYNIIGALDNEADSTIIIATHYDINASVKKEINKLNAATIENASSIAMMLLFADEINKTAYKENNYLFIAFAAHEDGFLGAKNFVAQNSVEDVKLIVYLDKISRLKYTYPQVNILRNKMGNYLDSTLLNLEKRNFDINILKRICLDDVSAFDEKNIPYMIITSGTQSDYSSKLDTPEKINYLGMNDIVDFMLAFLKKLEHNHFVLENSIVE